MKNAVSMVQIVMGAHKVLNKPENAEFKQKTAMEQHLIAMRNDYLTQSINSNNAVIKGLSDFRSAVQTGENSGNISRELNDISTNIQNSWNKSSSSPTGLRDKLTDLLRIIDPSSSGVPRVMSRAAYNAQSSN
jgi:hypothetical protein